MDKRLWAPTQAHALYILLNTNSPHPSPRSHQTPSATCTHVPYFLQHVQERQVTNSVNTSHQWQQTRRTCVGVQFADEYFWWEGERETGERDKDRDRQREREKEKVRLFALSSDRWRLIKVCRFLFWNFHAPNGQQLKHFIFSFQFSKQGRWILPATRCDKPNAG